MGRKSRSPRRFEVGALERIGRGDAPLFEDVEPNAVHRLVAMMLIGALRKGATGMRLLPSGERLTLFYRIEDGLVEEMKPPHRLRGMLAEIMVQLASLDAGDVRTGSFFIDGPDGTVIEVLVTLEPAEWGDVVDMRFVRAARALH